MAELLEIPVINWTDCPLVEINPRKLSGTPVLKGSRMPADAILENHADGLSAEEVAEIFELPVDSVRALLAYAAQRDFVEFLALREHRGLVRASIILSEPSLEAVWNNREDDVYNGL
jgi:uncharacterized protein (DUF433 family)